MQSQGEGGEKKKNKKNTTTKSRRAPGTRAVRSGGAHRLRQTEPGESSVRLRAEPSLRTVPIWRWQEADDKRLDGQLGSI
ncbi:hypothetical protein NDU88_006326 [Pleurodeles waltl]|uniref:Uncharacterized protein n=1 Tax=Pleurodeles waltl TaxID=8319 RepID=A0AAV7SPI9_PLEWA|nr:hypothetical protein NDU88_006326 [Pleurodeles waltl]